VIDRSIEENDLACIKHDFNVLDPTLDSPGTPPEIIREKIVDATIRLLSGTRAKRPGIFLSVTSGINLSPWWLWHADALWMGHGDYNHDWSFPQSTDRQAEMTYRDEKLYRRLHIERVPLPPSALMTHGIIRGRLDETNPPYDADDWSDYVVLTLGRGTELQELYLSPEVMEQGAWNILGQAILWAQRHAETFAHTVMVGGNPGRGEVYGYAHWSAGMGIFVYRNPSIVPCEVMLTQGERPTDLPRVDRWTPIVVYPHRERLAEMSMGRPGRLTLPGESVTVVHLHPDWPADWGEVPVGRFRLDPPAKLILPESSPRASLVPMVETIDEQTIWRARLALVGTERPVEIRLATDPVDGIRLRAGPAATRSVQRRDRWGLDRFDGWRTGLPIEAEILPTPAYPEQTRATAVMRTWSSVTSGASQSMAGEVPVWPMASQGGRESIEDHVLFESRIFTRGRKLIERVGWWWLLVLLPTSAAGVLSAWWTRGQPMLVRLAVWLLLGAGLSVVYLATPVTKGLLHLLLEEM
jgi:hypothetical protein